MFRFPNRHFPHQAVLSNAEPYRQFEKSQMEMNDKSLTASSSLLLRGKKPGLSSETSGARR